MNAPEKIRLTEFSHGGGCGCKMAPAVLSEILDATPMRGLPKELLVGTETADDAAVYRLNDSQALVATTDFFTPIVDEPYDFGRIAATNAISGISLVGSIVIAGGTGPHHSKVAMVLGFIAVVCSTTDVVGGFVITDRMLRMFKRKK